MTQPRHLLAITACPSGVAHTYMAAENLERTATELGFTMKVETHGQIGVENEFTAEEIERAEAIVIAADSKIDLSRFGGKRVVVSGVSDGIHHPGKLIKEALQANPLPAGGGSSTGVQTKQRTGLYRVLMNGVSHMIPFVVVGGLMIAFGYGLGGVPGPGGLKIPEGTFWATLAGLGGLGFNLMVPILSGYIAYAIADRPGLAPGMITGMLAVTPALYGSEAGAGFLGGIVTGLLSGAIALLIKKIPVHRYLAPIWPIIVIPVVTTLVVGLGFIYALGGPIAWFFTALTNWLAGMQGATPVLLGVVLGMMIGFDMGGPVNKVAFLFAGGLIATGNFLPQGMTSVAIAVPPIGMFLATLIARRLFDDEERESGIAAACMGFFGITEGAIPFAAAHPLAVIPANMIGAAVGAAVAGVLGVEGHVMWGGLIVAVVGGIGQPIQFVIALTIGSVVTAALAIVLMRVTAKQQPVQAGVGAEAPATAEPALATVGAQAPANRAVPVAEPAAASKAALPEPSILGYISEATITLAPVATTRDEMIAELTQLGAKTGQIADADAVIASALEREAIMSTGVGEGIAIPHAKCDGAVHPLVAFARTPGIDWNAPDGEPAKIVFLIAVPERDAGDEHLRILAKLSRSLMNPNVRSALENATAPGDVLEALRRAVD